MADNLKPSLSEKEATFAAAIASKAALKLKAQREEQGVWFGLGMSGLIGWSVAAPTVLGALVGWWWDRRHPSVHSWTLMLLVAGLTIGCANAWMWVVREDKAMRDEGVNKDV